MATETATGASYETNEISWGAAAVAGILGTIVFGGMQMVMGMSNVIAGAIAGLYTLGPSLAVGWAVHLFHGAVLGVVFAAVVGSTPLRKYADSVAGMVGLGLAYGVVTTILLAWLLMPVWLQTVGFPQAPPFPNVGMSSLVGHLVYGAVLGGVYAGLRNKL